MKVRTTLALLIAFSALTFGQNGSESLFLAKCANCHGKDGKGSKSTKLRMVDLSAKSVQQMSDDELYQSIAKGTNHKEYPHAYQYQGMSREQIQGLVAYIRSLGKK